MLTKDQIKVGQRIRQIAHPEYGVWIIKRHYDGTMWEVDKSGKNDGICTCEGELTKFWELAND